MTLRERCSAMLSKLQQDAILRQGDPVEDLMAFVVSETGRTADRCLDQALPLCLYFQDEAARADFVEIVRSVRPDMITKTMP